MPGLIENQLDQNAGAPEQQDMAPPADSPEMSAGEIKQFKEAYQLAKQFFYQEQVFDSLVEQVQQNPVDTIVGLVVTTMLRVQEETGPMPLPVVGALGIALFDDLGETLEKAGVMQNTRELQEQLFTAGVQLWLQSNEYPPEQIAQMVAEMGAPPEMVEQIAAQGRAAQQAPAPDPNAQPGGLPNG